MSRATIAFPSRARRIRSLLKRVLPRRSRPAAACWLVRGPERTTGRPIDFAYSGLERHKNYFANLACGRAFEETPLGSVPAPQLERTVRGVRPECAFIVEEIPWGAGAPAELRIPVWIETGFDLRGDRSFERSKSMDEHRRRVRKHGLVPSYSRSEDDFREFYSDLYLPHLRKAHGSAAYVEPYEEMKAAFAEGELVLVREEGKMIGGQLLRYSEDRVRLGSMGVRGGDDACVRMGLPGALVLFSVERAKEKGCAGVSLGYSRAFLKDGPFRFKARLGASLTGEFHHESGVLAVRFLKDTPGLRGFWSANPCVALDGAGFRGAFFCERRPADEAAVQALLKDSFCRGLERLRIFSFEGPEQAVLRMERGNPGQVEIRPASDLGPDIGLGGGTGG